MNKINTISRGVDNFLKESEGEYRLEYISKNGDMITSDYITGHDEAINTISSLADSYREYGTENTYRLELTDANGNMVASAEDPGWDIDIAGELNEDAGDIETAEEYLFDDMISTDGEPEDFEEFNHYVMDISKRDYNKALKNVTNVYNNIKDHIYNSDNKQYLELHDHHTMYNLTNEDRNPEEWGTFVETAIDSFEEATGVELWQAGRMGRHVIVELNYENAKRYDELVKVCEEMEQIAIDEFNAKEEPTNESEEAYIDPTPEMKIKDWYTSIAPEDYQLDKINAETTFADLKASYDKSKKLNLSQIGAIDSDPRNEIVTAFADLYDLPTNDIDITDDTVYESEKLSEEENIDWILSRHDDLDMVDEKGLGMDASYHTVVKSVDDAEKFNYHSDYWGSAEEYQDKAVDIVADFEPYMDKVVEYSTDDGETYKVKILGILIDKQYNSHIKVLVEWLDDTNEAEDPKDGTLVGRKYKCIKTVSHPNMGILIRKGKTCEVTDDRGNEITIGGINLYKHYLDTHFEEIKDGGSKELKEEILSEPIKDNIRLTIEKIDDLISTVKHVVEMDALTINSQIETINDKTSLNIEEIETGDFYSNLSSIKDDLEYALKDSDWSEEDAAENESEKLKESEKADLRSNFEGVESFEELRETIENIAEGYSDFYDDWLDIASEYEKKCVKYIKALSKTTTVSPKDEYGYESDYVKSAISEICKTDSLTEDDEWTTYEVTVGFCGYVGVEQEYNIQARSRQEAVFHALDEAGSEAEQDLNVESIEDLGDGTYDVEVMFAGLESNTYTVSADDEDDASNQALEQAKEDLDIISVDGEEFSYDESENLKEQLDPKKEAELKNIFLDLAKQYETTEEIVDALRSLNTEGKLNNADYDAIMLYWDKWLGDLDEPVKLKEAVSDEDKEAFLNSDITVYDIASFIENLDIDGVEKGEYTAHLGDKRALIETKDGKYVLADYEAVRDVVNSLNDKVNIDVSKKTSFDDKGHRTIPIFPAGSIAVTLNDIVNNAPSETMKARDFFTKYNYNDRCARNFSGMLDNINGIMHESQKLTESSLPDFCYSSLPSDGRKVIVIKRGESGYYPVDVEFETEDEAKSFIDKENSILGVDAKAKRAMEVGSMFGWDVPGANPDHEINKNEEV